jgi:hypothetical protein
MIFYEYEFFLYRMGVLSKILPRNILTEQSIYETDIKINYVRCSTH